MNLDHTTLKARHRQRREALPESLNLRTHRSLSWLKAAQEADQPDARFIFLWIAFNAAYSQKLENEASFGEQGRFREFLGKLIRLDGDHLLYDIAWKNYSGKIRLFINNPYVSRHFWDAHNGPGSKDQWSPRFERSCRNAVQALASRDTVVFADILFDRLYVLRNQLIHGGATFGSRINRAQVRDGSRILEEFVPAMLLIMMEHPEEDWGMPCYPPIEESALQRDRPSNGPA